MTDSKDRPPILANKHYASASAFTPESLLREARRQKNAPVAAVPKVCLLDPDGDIVRQLKADGRARRHDGWVCYHTDLFVFDEDGLTIGIVGCAVGASFAVLVVRLGLRAADQRDVLGTDHAGASAALFHSH